MKKLITTFAVLLVFAAYGWAQGGTLIPTGPASYTGTAPISISQNYAGAAPIAIQFTWAVPAGVSVTSISIGPIWAASKQLACSGTFPQTLAGTCIIYGLNTTSMGASVVAITALTPPAASLATSPAPITFTITSVIAIDSSGALIATTGGAVSIPFANKCDLTGDGAVDSKDVALIAQRLVAKPATATALCDFNGDGACDLRDYFTILTAALGGNCTAP